MDPILSKIVSFPVQRRSQQRQNLQQWLTAFKILKILVILVKVFSNFKKITETATGGVVLKKMLLNISQNSQENTCARVSFIIKLQLYEKRDSGTGVFLWILQNF